MKQPDHPGLRPTRHHWAAALNPLHLIPACGGWASVIGLLGAGGESYSGLASVLALGSLSWSILWLLVVPVTPAWKRIVDSRLVNRFESDFAYRAEQLAQENKQLIPYIKDLYALRDKARSVMLRRFGEHDPFAKDNLAKLDKLAISYLQLLRTLSDYDDYLSVVNPSSIEADIAAAEAGLHDGNSELGKLRERQLLLLRNRLERYRKVEERLKVLKEEAASIETTMKLLADQAMTIPKSQDIWRDIDSVLDNMRESELLSQDLAVFEDFERAVRDSGRLRSR